MNTTATMQRESS